MRTLVRPHPSQGGNVCLVQLHEDDFILTHPAIACNAAEETLTVVINLDESVLAVGAAFIHGPTIAKLIADKERPRTVRPRRSRKGAEIREARRLTLSLEADAMP
jgi:hypothetical protein